MLLVFAYERVCKEAVGTRARKATLYKIEDKVAKINQAIHDVSRGLYLTYSFGSRLKSLIGSEYEPQGTGHFGLFFDTNLPLSKK